MKRFLPLIVLLLGALYLASTLREPRDQAGYNLTDFGRVPVLVGGRIKPLDTVARTSILSIRGSQYIATPDGKSITPDAWLADVLFHPAKADTYKIFLIENHEVVDLLKLNVEDGDGKKRFSYEQIRAQLPELERQARMVDSVEEPLRTPFQKQIMAVQQRVILYMQLKASVQVPDSPDFLSELVQFDRALPAGIAAVRAKQANQPHSEDAVNAMRQMADRFSYIESVGNLRIVPPENGDTNAHNWRTAGSALIESFGTGRVNPTVLGYAALGHAWRKGDVKQFNAIVATLHDELAKRYPEAMRKSDVESRFNAAAPFYSSMTLYVLTFLIAVFSWLKWPDTLQRSAFWLLALAFVATTAGILTRMWLESRPPVTNLYSSALFIGWATVLLCLILEKVFKNAVGSVAGGLVGFATLLIAHHLSLSGDTLEMMRAVLDSNFWLATHVVTVTVGYSATYLAGFLAIIYIFRGVFTKSLDQGTADALYRMVYGIVCFATLFSLIGTVLGGIWADQSWGRFWGWDPKENGALIIVIWNAIILHARWGGMVKARGMMAMAVFGNIVTSWSWFGTNMLGVGLHSYGFMEAAFYWLIGFVISQLLIIALAAIPLEKWKSFAAEASTP
ncbi:cytochrome c biogenesis protein [Oleiharenicola sp. Vm1]|uniref:cytochrome c biogenesis protein n=1 Tax=Oleiharenicola sp. Vm1 TaxID=3398393 RepID=UPI0039F57165